MNELFNLPPSEPPLTMKVHLARIAVGEAETAADEAENESDWEHWREMRKLVNMKRRDLARLEHRLLQQTRGTLPPKSP